MKTYKHAVRERIQALLDTGLTQKEVAERLEFDNPNNVSMLMSDRYPNTVLAPSKLPLLQKVCGLPNGEALALLRLLARSGRGGSKAMHIDLATVDWFILTTVRARHEVVTRLRAAAAESAAPTAAGVGHV